MREVKFRAWDTVSKKMYPLASLWYSKRGELSVSVRFKASNTEPTLVKPNRMVLLQFTGLKDKNGVEIYEGDVLKVTNRQLITGQYVIRQVVWNTETARFNGIPLTHQAEVIGNIYENPELLEAKR